MNRSFGSLAFVAVVVAALAGGEALGQTQVVTKKATVTFSGKLDLTTVYRSDEYFTSTKGDGTAASPGTAPFVEWTNGEVVYPGAPVRNNRDSSEFYLDPNLSLMFAIDVGDQARGVIELRTPFVNPDAGGKNSSVESSFFTNWKDRTLEVKQLYAEVDELFQPGPKEKGSGLLLRAGIQDFRKDLRGDGNYFLIDVSGSEHPFDSASGTGAPMRYSTGSADSTEAAGGYARYQVSVLSLDGWFFNLDEGYNSSANERDLLFFGGSADIHFDTEKKYGKVFLTVFDLMNESNTHVVTEGFGVVFNPFFTQEINLLQLFGEFYYQQGTYARNMIGTFDVEQSNAYALNIGAEAKIPDLMIGEKKFIPYGEVSFVQVSGDEVADDTENSNFISLENNNRTLIVENGYYGYDFDTNYRGPRFAAGFHYGKFQFEVLYAYFEYLKNKVSGYPRISGAGLNGGSPSWSNKIGDEIDITLAYEYSASLKLALQAGWLLDSHALGQLSATQITLFTIALEF